MQIYVQVTWDNGDHVVLNGRQNMVRPTTGRSPEDMVQSMIELDLSNAIQCISAQKTGVRRFLCTIPELPTLSMEQPSMACLPSVAIDLWVKFDLKIRYRQGLKNPIAPLTLGLLEIKQRWKVDGLGGVSPVHHRRVDPISSSAFRLYQGLHPLLTMRNSEVNEAPWPGGSLLSPSKKNSWLWEIHIATRFLDITEATKRVAEWWSPGGKAGESPMDADGRKFGYQWRSILQTDKFNSPTKRDRRDDMLWSVVVPNKCMEMPSKKAAANACYLPSQTGPGEPAPKVSALLHFQTFPDKSYVSFTSNIDFWDVERGIRSPDSFVEPPKAPPNNDNFLRGNPAFLWPRYWRRRYGGTAGIFAGYGREIVDASSDKTGLWILLWPMPKGIPMNFDTERAGADYGCAIKEAPQPIAVAVLRLLQAQNLLGPEDKPVVLDRVGLSGFSGGGPNALQSLRASLTESPSITGVMLYDPHGGVNSPTKAVWMESWMQGLNRQKVPHATYALTGGPRTHLWNAVARAVEEQRLTYLRFPQSSFYEKGAGSWFRRATALISNPGDLHHDFCFTGGYGDGDTIRLNWRKLFLGSMNGVVVSKALKEQGLSPSFTEEGAQTYACKR